jgi:hypothetical protein
MNKELFEKAVDIQDNIKDLLKFHSGVLHSDTIKIKIFSSDGEVAEFSTKEYNLDVVSKIESSILEILGDKIKDLEREFNEL